MERVNLLDHGYIEMVTHWGSDEGIIEAARMSTNKGFLGWGPKIEQVRQCEKCMIIEDEVGGKDSCPMDNGQHEYGFLSVDRHIPGDEKLLKYLYENKHHTPFEMAGATFEVQAPIMVFREWHRHRTQSYNEMSARYTPLPDLNYIPTVDRLMLNSKTNKQAGIVKGAEELTEGYAIDFQKALRRMYAEQENLYQCALQHGVPKELARVHLPVGRYSRMRASANLRNWIGFLTLRMAPNAQWEIRVYANALCAMLKQEFPRTMSLYLSGFIT